MPPSTGTRSIHLDPAHRSDPGSEPLCLERTTKKKHQVAVAEHFLPLVETPHSAAEDPPLPRNVASAQASYVVSYAMADPPPEQLQRRIDGFAPSAPSKWRRSSGRRSARTTEAASFSPSAHETMPSTCTRAARSATPTWRGVGGTPPTTLMSRAYPSEWTVTSKGPPARFAERSARSFTTGLPPQSSVLSQPHGPLPTYASLVTTSGIAV